VNLRSLARGLTYAGEVPAKRQTYHVFEGKRYFLVMSQSRSKRNAGNFNVVRADAVEYVARRFERKRKVTSTDVARASRKPRLVSTSLDALNVLYVLVATNRAEINKKFRKERQLYFDVSGKPPAPSRTGRRRKTRRAA
jgi:hypothetical protein